jgi:hypothetical protein
MPLITAVYATIEISKVMIPPIFLGFFVASIIRSSSYFRYLSLPTSRLASVANLPAECSAALTLYLMNSWTALAMLSELHKKKAINDNDLIVAVLIGFIPKGFHSMIFFSVPVAVSVLGLHAGGVYVCLDMLASFFVAFVGIFVGRSMLKHRASLIIAEEDQILAEKWTVKIMNGLKESVHSSARIIKILIPTIFLAQLAIDYVLLLPVVETYSSIVEPLGISSSSLIVLLASVVSQSAALVASGTLLSNGSISAMGCLLLLFVARFLHLGIGFFRIGIPSNISYFGSYAGLRVTVIEYLLIEIANILLILVLFLSI